MHEQFAIVYIIKPLMFLKCMREELCFIGWDLFFFEFYSLDCFFSYRFQLTRSDWSQSHYVVKSPLLDQGFTHIPEISLLLIHQITFQTPSSLSHPKPTPLCFSSPAITIHQILHDWSATYSFKPQWYNKQLNMWWQVSFHLYSDWVNR